MVAPESHVYSKVADILKVIVQIPKPAVSDGSTVFSS
jgi:hypothetical protein